MIELYLARHGETEGNKSGITQGQTDSGLTEKGKKEAEQLALRLKDVKFEKIFTSTLGRARATAEIINKHHNQEIIPVEELKERGKGGWDGMRMNEVHAQHPDLEERWAREEDVRPPDGENMEDVHNRVIPFIENVIKEANGKILFIAHGSLNAVILGHFMNIPHNLRYRYEQDNCCLNIVTIDGRHVRVKHVNDVSHITE